MVVVAFGHGASVVGASVVVFAAFGASGHGASVLVGATVVHGAAVTSAVGKLRWSSSLALLPRYLLRYCNHEGESILQNEFRGRCPLPSLVQAFRTLNMSRQAVPSNALCAREVWYSPSNTHDSPTSAGVTCLGPLGPMAVVTGVEVHGAVVVDLLSTSGPNGTFSVSWHPRPTAPRATSLWALTWNF